MAKLNESEEEFFEGLMQDVAEDGEMSVEQAYYVYGFDRPERYRTE